MDGLKMYRFILFKSKTQNAVTQNRNFIKIFKNIARGTTRFGKGRQATDGFDRKVRK